MPSPITSVEQQLISSLRPYIQNTAMYTRPETDHHLWIPESVGNEWGIDALGYCVSASDELNALISCEHPGQVVPGRSFHVVIEKDELRIDFRGQLNSQFLAKLSDGFMDSLGAAMQNQKTTKPVNNIRVNQMNSLQQSQSENLLLDNLEVFFRKKEFDIPPASCNWLHLDLPVGVSRDLGLSKVGIYINLFDNLSAAISDTCIYDDVTRDNYYLKISDIKTESAQDKQSLYLSVEYQRIIGGKKLMTLSEDFMVSLLSRISSQVAEKNNQGHDHIEPGEGQSVNNDVSEQLLLLTVGDHKIHLPEQHLSQYAVIKALMLKAGATYNSKGYFSFDKGYDASEIMEKLLSGGKVNVKQETQFFATSESRSELACDALGDVNGKRLLEPSAGDGAMADVARRRGADVVVIENWAPNVHKLEDKGYAVINRDFLTVRPEEIGLFDAILANPPFSKGQDVAHINHMMSFLKSGGTLSVIASMSAIEGTQKKQIAFQEFLSDHNARIEIIPAGEFKSSGTSVPTCHIALIKTGLYMQEDPFESDSESGFSMQ